MTVRSLSWNGRKAGLSSEKLYVWILFNSLLNPAIKPPSSRAAAQTVCCMWHLYQIPYKLYMNWYYQYWILIIKFHPLAASGQKLISVSNPFISLHPDYSAAIYASRHHFLAGFGFLWQPTRFRESDYYCCPLTTPPTHPNPARLGCSVH